jgi:hypothetical protein
MTKSRRFTLSVSNQNKVYNVGHFEHGSDGSSYITPSLGNKMGMHLSLHPSGVTHIATKNPPASARFMRQGFITDIMNKRSTFINNNALFKPKDHPGIMMILRTGDLFDKLSSAVAVTNRKMIIDLQTIMKSSVMVTTDSMTYACDYLLRQKHYIKDTDLVMIGDSNGDVTFLAAPMCSDLSNPRVMTINPNNLDSLMRLPGIEPIMAAVKELAPKISTPPYNRSYNDTDLDFSNLLPWMNLQLRSAR